MCSGESKSVKKAKRLVLHRAALIPVFINAWLVFAAPFRRPVVSQRVRAGADGQLSARDPRRWLVHSSLARQLYGRRRFSSE